MGKRWEDVQARWWDLAVGLGCGGAGAQSRMAVVQVWMECYPRVRQGPSDPGCYRYPVKAVGLAPYLHSTAGTGSPARLATRHNLGRMVGAKLARVSSPVAVCVSFCNLSGQARLSSRVAS